MDYPYRTAVVTGASSGLGREFARLLAARGTSVVLVARRADRLEALAGELAGQYGVDTEVLVADLGEDKELRRVEERLSDPSRPVDLLVSNAGYDVSGFFAELGPQVAPGEIAVNVVAPVRLARAALGGMLQRGSGGLLFVSSAVGSMPLPRSAAYGASKAFVTSFAESLHMETALHGVHVTSVSAGLMHTEFHQQAGIDTAGMPKSAWMPAARVAGASLEAVAAGKAVVVPGLFNKLQAPLYRIMPRSLLRAMVRRFYR
jgi:uncharacterized protein